MASVNRNKRDRQFRRSKLICFYCKAKTVFHNSTAFEPMPLNAATIDHIVPKCIGGSNSNLNLVTACFSCNQNKQHSSDQMFQENRKRYGIKN